MRWIARMLLALCALFAGRFAGLGIPATGAGLAAKNVCSGVFVAGRAAADVLAADVLPASALLRLAQVEVDASGGWSAADALVGTHGRLLPGLGCVLDPTPALLQAAVDPDAAARIRGRVAAGRPTRTAWPDEAPHGPHTTDWRGIDRDAIAPPSTRHSTTAATRQAATRAPSSSCIAAGWWPSAMAPASMPPRRSSAGR